MEAKKGPGKGRQIAVRSGRQVVVTPVSPNDLKELRLGLNQSLGKFGRMLAVEVGRPDPYTRQYVSDLEQGRWRIPPLVAEAFWRIASAADGVDPDVNAHPASVLARYEINGALVGGAAVGCARPGCKVRFVKTSNAQKYHSAWCRKQVKR
jgi:hypothetical protein